MHLVIHCHTYIEGVVRQHCVRVTAMEPGTEWAFVGPREQDSSVAMYCIVFFA